jgi:hypothetical protein
MGEKAVTGAVQPMTTWTIWKISDKRNLAAFQESEIIRKAKSKQNQSKIKAKSRRVFKTRRDFMLKQK